MTDCIRITILLMSKKLMKLTFEKICFADFDFFFVMIRDNIIEISGIRPSKTDFISSSFDKK